MIDPRREARPLSAEEIQAASTVTPEDVDRAKVAAERDGSALLRAMLNALPDEGM